MFFLVNDSTVPEIVVTLDNLIITAYVFVDEIGTFVCDSAHVQLFVGMKRRMTPSSCSDVKPERHSERKKGTARYSLPLF